MKYLFSIFFLILCSCLSEEKVKIENALLPNSSSSTSSSSAWNSTIEYIMSLDIPAGPIRFGPCPRDSVKPNPLILKCPPKDIAECPIEDPLEFHGSGSSGCVKYLRLSKEELSFNAQGGVRCVTTTDSRFFSLRGIRDYSGEYFEGNNYLKLKYPKKDTWLTATRVSDRVLHISVNQNKTKAERKIYIETNCKGSILITQSAE